VAGQPSSSSVSVCSSAMCDKIIERMKINHFLNLVSLSFSLYLQQGYFRTSTGSFYIEPIEDYADENRNILHLLYREPRRDGAKGDSEKCDLPDSHGECFAFFLSAIFTSHSESCLKAISACLYNNKYLAHISSGEARGGN
jgi:hypothetical protein